MNMPQESKVKEAAADARRQEEEVGGFLLVQPPCSYFSRLSIYDV
jgi:hypothetical protein